MVPLYDVPNTIATKEKKEKAKKERDLVTQWLHPVLEKAGWEPRDPDGPVQQELTGAGGRVDLAIKVKNRIRICIEVKSPSVLIDEIKDGKRIHLEQAIKYGRSYYFPLDGVIEPIMCICTNGKTAIVMDPALERATSPSFFHKFSLTSEDSLSFFVSTVINKDLIENETGALPYIKTKTEQDQRPFASKTEKDFLEYVDAILKKFMQGGFLFEKSLSMTVQLLLLAAARDHGVLPNSQISQAAYEKDWCMVAKSLNKLFGDIFDTDLSKVEVDSLWSQYHDTSHFNVRLDVFPVRYIGAIYEALLHRDKKQKNKTSFFTPEKIIDKILDECKPTISDSVLDPTCGSGAFLSRVIEYVWSETSKLDGVSEEEKKNLLTSFIRRIEGVDKDINACKIAKVTLLCSFMRIAGESYGFTNHPPFPRPQIHLSDFHYWNGAKNKYTLILGNPPWESIDSLPLEEKDFLRSYSCYEDKNDQLCYILEKSLISHLAEQGRFGFVIKLQSLSGMKYRKFGKFVLDHRVSKIYDYGAENLFNNGAQSAIVCGMYKSVVWDYEFIAQDEKAEILNASIDFCQEYKATQGAQSSADKIYENFAHENPKSKCIRDRPGKLTLGGSPVFVDKIAYFMGDAPRDFEQWAKTHSLTHRKKEGTVEDLLKSRRDVIDSGRNVLAWRRDFTRKLDGSIIIADLNSPPNFQRTPLLIDHDRRYTPSMGHICIASIAGRTEDIYFLASLILSRFFLPSCHFYRMPIRANNGVCLNPGGLSKRFKIPVVSSKDKDALVNIMTNVSRAHLKNRSGANLYT